MIARVVAALFAVTVLGCSAQESSAAKSDDKPNLIGLGRKHHTFDLGADSYSPKSVGAGGSVSGTITLEGAVPLATAAVTSDQQICRNVPSAVQTGTKGSLSNAIVWIADAKTGKALPMDKRVVISSDNCAIEPRAQAAVVGSTVNFFNDDKVFHRMVFIRSGTNDTLVVMPFFNDGQVVPTEKLAKESGVVDVRCARHPWMRGSLVVFDHPYFAVTEKDGRFKLDSLPPGEYHLMIWHEGLSKPIERKISIQAGSAGKVDVAVNLGAL